MNILRERLNIDFHPQFLSEEKAEEAFKILEKRVPWSNLITQNHRVNQNYGDDGLKYVVKIKDKEIHRVCRPWKEQPILQEIKESLEKTTGVTYNYCVVQRYPSGKVGINPHRDKEMKKGSLIAGISLGVTRKLCMIPPTWNQKDKGAVEFELNAGSLYVLKPPTNDHWQHSIERDATVKGVRISLTFRTL